MHAEPPIIDGRLLMATDMLGSMGQRTRIGNNTTPCLDIDSRDEADRLYGARLHVTGADSAIRDQPRRPEYDH